MQIFLCKFFTQIFYANFLRKFFMQIFYANLCMQISYANYCMQISCHKLFPFGGEGIIIEHKTDVMLIKFLLTNVNFLQVLILRFA